MKRIEEIFGQVLRKHRTAQGISQESFAEKAGIHRTYMSSIELGKVQVSIGIADKLAQALGVSLSKMWREVERQMESD